MKRCFPSYVITEMQIKTTKYHCIPIRMAKIWNTDNINADELMKQQKLIISLLVFSLIVQLVKNPPSMRETLVQFLDWEDPQEKGKATYSSILDWRIPWTVHGIAELDTTEWLSLSFDGGNAEWSSNFGRQFGCLVVPYNT